MLIPPAEAFGYAGMTVSAVATLPQLARLLRNRSSGGVSAATWALSASSYGLWASYGITAHVIPQIPGNIVSCCVALVILALTCRLRNPRCAVIPLTAILVAVIVFQTQGAQALGWLAFAAASARTLPQLRLAIRAPDLAGLSANTWALTSAGSAMWLVYAVLHRDLPVLCASIWSLLTAGLIVLVGRARGSAGGALTQNARRPPARSRPLGAAPASDPAPDPRAQC